jgi:hypothetical protein
VASRKVQKGIRARTYGTYVIADKLWRAWCDGPWMGAARGRYAAFERFMMDKLSTTSAAAY